MLLLFPFPGLTGTQRGPIIFLAGHNIAREEI